MRLHGSWLVQRNRHHQPKRIQQMVLLDYGCWCIKYWMKQSATCEFLARLTVEGIQKANEMFYTWTGMEIRRISWLWLSITDRFEKRQIRRAGALVCLWNCTIFFLRHLKPVHPPDPPELTIELYPGSTTMSWSNSSNWHMLLRLLLHMIPSELPCEWYNSIKQLGMKWKCNPLAAHYGWKITPGPQCYNSLCSDCNNTCLYVCVSAHHHHHSVRTIVRRCVRCVCVIIIYSRIS